MMRFGGRPNAGVRVSLVSLTSYPRAFHLSYTATTSKEGNFVFTSVPAGEYKIYRTLTWQTGRSITEDHQITVVVKAGETVRLEYGGEGRKIIGQASTSNPDLPVDWLNDDHTLTLK